MESLECDYPANICVIANSQERGVDTALHQREGITDWQRGNPVEMV